MNFLKSNNSQSQQSSTKGSSVGLNSNIQAANPVQADTTPLPNIPNYQGLVNNGENDILKRIENELNPNQLNSTSIDFNTSKNDTFNEDYPKTLQVSHPLSVKSNNDGVKEFKQYSSVESEKDDKEELDNNLNKQEPVSVSQDNTLGDLSVKTYNLNEILAKAIEIKASDIHLTPGYRVTYRVNGDLKSINSPVLTTQDVITYSKEILAKRKDVKFEDIYEIDLTYVLDNKRFRVNLFRQMGQYSISLRVINEEILNAESLGLPPVVNSIVNYPNGLVLVTGPTGSGKSTTIASLLNLINLTVAKHIITLEDPIEFVLPKAISLIDQREYGTDFQSWNTAIRSVLRQDPNIVLVGELRDLESVEAALQVAETGHLVFGTLHTNSASQSIDRIIDIFPADKQDQIRVQLASVIRAVLSQRLVTVNSGGRMPVIELILSNIAISNAIRENKVYTIDNIIQTSTEEGMISMERSLVNLVKEGEISVDQAKSLSLRSTEIDLLLNK